MTADLVALAGSIVVTWMLGWRMLAETYDFSRSHRQHPELPRIARQSDDWRGAAASEVVEAEQVGGK